MSTTPGFRGLYLCQRVDVDPATQDLTLVRCFQILVRDPATGSAGNFCLFGVLADGSGHYPLAVRIIRLDTMAPVYSTLVRVTLPDRLRDVRFKLLVEQCRFTTAGRYEASVWYGETNLAQTPFRVRDRKETGDE